MNDGFDLPDPVDVNRAQFETVKKGYDPAEVRAYLADVARGLGSYRELVKDLERRIGTLETELSEAEQAATTELTEAELTERLGSETARILDAARDAAEERRDSVEAEVEQALAEAAEQVTAARDEARRLVETAQAEAVQLVADKMAETDADVAELRAANEAEMQALVADAEARAEALVADGEVIRAEALESARSMVAEAQVVRERILGDLARRRQSGRRELEQIRAGRDRLLAAFHLAGDELGGLLEELNLALPEARAAAQRAGHSVDLEEVTPEQIEHELEAARLVGHPLVAPNVDAPVEVAHDDIDVDEGLAGEAVDEELADVEAPVVGATAVDAAPSALADDEEGENVVLAELGARRSRLTKAGRIAQQLPTGEIPVLKAAPPFEAVRVIDEDTEGPTPGEDDTAPEPDDEAVAEAEVEAAAEVEAEPAEAEPEIEEAQLEEEGEVEAASEVEPEIEAEPAEAASEVEPEIEEAVEAEAAVAAEVDETVEAEASEEGEVEAEPAEAEPAEAEPEVEAASEVEAEIDEAVEAEAADETAEEPEPTDVDEPVGATAVPEVDDEAVDALFAKVRASADPEPVEDAAAVATLTRARVTVLDQDPIATRDDAIESIEQRVARALKRALADDQNDLLDAARQARSVGSVADLVDVDEHRRRYLEPVHADLVEAFHAGATAGGDPSVDTDLEAAEAAVATEVVDRLRHELDGVIAADPDDLDDRLRSLARDLRRNRLGEAASFVVLTAYNRGVERALADSPRRWVRDERHECGLDCEANARSGAVPAGHRFDGEVTHPPMFPGCRCQLTGAGQ